jgi:hypothetical protein
MTISDYIGVPDQLRSICTCSMTSTSPVGPFSNEYIFIFTFDESGTQIKHIVEMMDSAAVKDIFARLAAAGGEVKH